MLKAAIINNTREWLDSKKEINVARYFSKEQLSGHRGVLLNTSPKPISITIKK
jgi:hypothetical protein